MTGETILLVEDEPSIRRLMVIGLEAAGYDVIEARNGTDALKQFTPNVDLLLVDMKLPYLSGAGVITRLRARRPSLRVLAISGYPLAAPEDERFLEKPFGKDQLLAAVRGALDEGPAPH